MPSIDVAMARSLRPSTFELLRDAVARSIAADLEKRDVLTSASNKVSDIKTALSSWDNCMSFTWCKWPVIAIIVVGGLIILSIVTCIIRCCCCGLSCCCSCCQCLKCCGDCCGCCDPPGDRKHKHLDDPYAPSTNHHGYRSEPPMEPSLPVAASNNQFAPQTSHYNEPPKYAEFEVRSGKRDSDALPEMPSMEKAEITTKVGLHDDVEMNDLKKSPMQDQQYAMNNGTPSSMPQGRGMYNNQQGSQSSYFNQHNQIPESYSPIDKGYGYHNNHGSDGYDHQQSYSGSAVGSQAPAQNYNGYDHGQGQDQYGQYNGYSNGNQGYGASHPGPSLTPAPPAELNGYGYGLPTSRSPAPQNSYDDYHHNDYNNQLARKTPALPETYTYDNNQQGYGNQQSIPALPEAHYGPRPVPQRQYPQDPPRSPLNNNSGFDFNSGFSRPDASPTTEAYPGYKPYSPK